MFDSKLLANDPPTPAEELNYLEGLVHTKETHIDTNGKVTGYTHDNGSYKEHSDVAGNVTGYTHDNGSYKEHTDVEGNVTGYTYYKGLYKEHSEEAGDTTTGHGHPASGGSSSSEEH